MNSLHHELAQRPLHLVHRLFAVLAVHNQLRNQRVVVRRHNALGILRRIHAHAIASRQIERRNLARGRRELLRMLRIDAALDRMPANLHRLRHDMLDSFSPAAIRNCAFTRSIPVTISVTGCSTWMRVFISMK